MNRQCFLLCSILLLFALLSTPVQADLILTPQWAGPGVAEIVPGSPFALNFELTSDSSDSCDSVIFDVAFYASGSLLTNVTINDYTWGGNFSGSLFDNSNPTTYHFENFIFSDPPFTTGTLLSLTATLPASTPLPNALSVHARPRDFALGTEKFTPQAGPDLLLQVVPEPRSTVLLLVACSTIGILGHSTIRREHSVSRR